MDKEKTKEQQRAEAWEAYIAITGPALKAYEVKCKEIDAQDDETIIIVGGKTYKLIEE